MDNFELAELIDKDYFEALKELLADKNTHLVSYLRFMRLRGSSAILDYGEDNDLWECSFITGGKRFTGYSKNSQKAVIECLKKTLEEKL